MQYRRRERRRYSVPAVINDMKGQLQRTGQSALNAQDGGAGRVQF